MVKEMGFLDSYPVRDRLMKSQVSIFALTELSLTITYIIQKLHHYFIYSIPYGKVKIFIN